MRKYFNLLLASGFSGSLSAQFVNNGATVVVQSGATLRIETNFINNSGSTVTNNGTIEVKGDFTNSATFTSANPSTVKFIGAGASTITSGGAELRNLTIEKDAGSNVALADNLTVAGVVNFNGANNKIVLGAYDLTVKAGGSVNGTDSDEYVHTSGNGKLIKGITGNSSPIMEVGDATNYTPITNVITGTAYAAATVSARVYTSGLETKQAGATDYIAREWAVASTGITDYANTMTGTYVSGDATGTQANIKGSTFHTASWKFTDASAGALTVTGSTTTNSVKFTGQNFFGKVNIKAYLQGPYSGGVMTTALNAVSPAPNMLETYALTSPYGDAPASVTAGFFLANPTIVDWVKIELRDPSAPSTATAFKASAFIKSNGDIVGLDGTSLPTVKNGFATSVVVLSHRNHLAIRTPNTGISVAEGASKHDFSTGIGQAYTDANNFSNDNMANLGAGLYGLIRGDVDGDLFINVADASIVKSASVPNQADVYSASDVDMDTFINILDPSVVKSESIPNKAAHN